MSIEIQCMTEKLIAITIKLDYSKVPNKSTVPTTGSGVRPIKQSISRACRNHAFGIHESRQ